MGSRTIIFTLWLVVACSGKEPVSAPQEPAEAEAPVSILDQPTPEIAALQMFMLDCGVIEISDLDVFSSTGDYAGQTDTFADTCWLLRHPKGDFLWDLGLPTDLAGVGKQENGVFTLSLDRTISDQLAEIGLFASDIDWISISHSHFDHSGQADQFQNAKWVVHADEYAAMFPAELPAQDVGAETANPFANFASLQREEFTGEYDVFGDGSAIIVPTPGHTPGHTALWINLPEMGPVFLTGDLYHRSESRELKRVPRFNHDEAATRTSMEVFEARAEATGARVIIQHERDDVADLPSSPAPIR